MVNTFHAYAKAVLGKECGQILVDDSSPIRTRLIKQIISHFRTTDSSFEKQLNKYFLSDTLKVDRKKFSNIEHYYRFIRNSRYRTLKGEHVKSIPEKIISDFLFEHGIKYKYERHFYLPKIDSTPHKLSFQDLQKFLSIGGEKRDTAPDFYLEDYNLIWEHWGITGNETAEEKAEFTREVGDYDIYAHTKEWKRSFWNYWRYKIMPAQRYRHDFKSVRKLIETDPNNFDLSQDKNYIEYKLKKLLEYYGVKCERLPDERSLEKRRRLFHQTNQTVYR